MKAYSTYRMFIGLVAQLVRAACNYLLIIRQFAGSSPVKSTTNKS
jgi:hypothetical protein